MLSELLNDVAPRVGLLCSTQPARGGRPGGGNRRGKHRSPRRRRTDVRKTFGSMVVSEPSVEEGMAVTQEQACGDESRSMRRDALRQTAEGRIVVSLLLRSGLGEDFVQH